VGSVCVKVEVEVEFLLCCGSLTLLNAACLKILLILQILLNSAEKMRQNP